MAARRQSMERKGGGDSEEVVGIDARAPAPFKHAISSPADPPYQLHHIAGSPASGRGSSPSWGRLRTVTDGGDKQRARLMGASRAVPVPFPPE
jgi:hypothetical protein